MKTKFILNTLVLVVLCNVYIPKQLHMLPSFGTQSILSQPSIVQPEIMQNLNYGMLVSSLLAQRVNAATSFFMCITCQCFRLTS